MALNRKDASARLKRKGAFLFVTHGNESVFAIEGAGSVSRKTASELTGGLFSNMPVVVQIKGHKPLIASEDGLFPGMSQTFYPES